MSTKIEWTDKTWNPIIGCSKISPACDHCYAEKMAFRLACNDKAPKEYMDVVGGTNGSGWNGKTALVASAMETPLHWRKPCRVFVGSMTDLFHPSTPFEWLDRVFAVMALTPHITYQVLTKRPDRMQAYINDTGTPRRVSNLVRVIESGRLEEMSAPERVVPVNGWPGYFVTSKGRVLSDRSNSGLRATGKLHELKPQYGEQGHARVMLQVQGEKSRPLIHRLVLEHFDRMPNCNEQACHLTGDASNNALWNLKWGSQSENWEDSKRHGTARRYSKLSPESVEAIRARLNAGESAYSISRDVDVSDTQIRNISTGAQWKDEGRLEWPLRSVWLGVTVENQAMADKRIPILLDTPAAVRFVSVEPMLRPVDLSEYMSASAVNGHELGLDDNWIDGLDWVICGGETGPGARPMWEPWARDLMEQCEADGIPFFFKKWGAYRGPDDWKIPAGDKIGGRIVREFPEENGGEVDNGR